VAASRSRFFQAKKCGAHSLRSWQNTATLRPLPTCSVTSFPPLRPHFLASLLSGHPSTVLHPHANLQDALHVALTKIQPPSFQGLVLGYATDSSIKVQIESTTPIQKKKQFWANCGKHAARGDGSFDSSGVRGLNEFSVKLSPSTATTEDSCEAPHVRRYWAAG